MVQHSLLFLYYWLMVFYLSSIWFLHIWNIKIWKRVSFYFLKFIYDINNFWDSWLIGLQVHQLFLGYNFCFEFFIVYENFPVCIYMHSVGTCSSQCSKHDHRNPDHGIMSCCDSSLLVQTVEPTSMQANEFSLFLFFSPACVDYLW